MIAAAFTWLAIFLVFGLMVFHLAFGVPIVKDANFVGHLLCYTMRDYPLAFFG